MADRGGWLGKCARIAALLVGLGTAGRVAWAGQGVDLIACDGIAVASGDRHSLLLTGDGSVWSWGFNDHGQLGRSATLARVPRPVDGLPAITAIAAGGDHSLALAADATVWAWGANWAGQLGTGITGGGVQQGAPVPVHVLGDDGNPLTGIVAIAAGRAHSLAVSFDGTVWAWGRGVSSQLGDGQGLDTPVPVHVADLSEEDLLLHDVIAVAAGEEHSLALRRDGTVRAWGDNLFGSVGNGTNQPASRAVPALGVTDAVAIAAGRRHSLALRRDGTLVAWGWNASGQLGSGTTSDAWTPSVMPIPSVVRSIAAGFNHSLAIAGGATWAWGDDTFGQLGDGSRGDNAMEAESVQGLSSALSLAGGYSSSVALLADGSLWTWGVSLERELGNGETSGSARPERVAGPPPEIDDGRDLDESGLAQPLLVQRDAQSPNDVLVTFEPFDVRTGEAVYRGTLAALSRGTYDHAPATDGCSVFASPWRDAGAAVDGGGVYYLVASRCAGGWISSLGRDSFGGERADGGPGFSACP